MCVMESFHASLVTPSERLPSFPERMGLTDNNLKTEEKEKLMVS
jgi:hypothetical protein